VLADKSCSIESANLGFGHDNCLPLVPYVKKYVDSNCELAKPIPLTENIGMFEPIARLPGCNPITYSSTGACSEGFDPKTMNNNGTFHIQSKITGGYLTSDHITENVFANASTIDPSYRQVWGLGWAPRDQGRTIRNSEINKHFTMQSILKVRDLVVDTWEVFTFEKQSDTNYIAIKNQRHGKYLRVEKDFTITGTATTITDDCLFQLVTPDGGYVHEGLKLSNFSNMSINIG
jgi:hypothetical protein